MFIFKKIHNHLLRILCCFLETKKQTTKNHTHISILISIATLISFCSVLQAQTASIWVTAGDQSKKLQKQSDISFGTSSNSTKITLNENTQYQTIDGFGHCMTEGSAETISRLSPTLQDSLLKDLFDLKSGIGMSVLRVTIGASDLGNGTYSYSNVTDDTGMVNFSFKGVDSTYLLPILKKVVAINPNIKILGSPWTPPIWMKTNNAYKGGSLQTKYYQAYANYFVKYIQGMKALGIPIWAITVQNEPLNPNNTPSCTWTMQQEANFVNNNLGPSFEAAGINTKIIAYDHNCDVTNYPIYVCTTSTYVDGAAFHLYGGNISAMTTVHNATKKNVYFTEQCTCGDNFSSYFSSHMRNVFMGSLTNWSKAVIEWNLSTDSNLGPHTDNGGCGICYGGVMVNNSSSYSLYSSYYLVAQFSKVIKTDAVRIATTTTNNNLLSVAAINPDGTRAVVVYNNTGSNSNFDIVWDGKAVPFSLANNATASFVWAGPTTIKESRISVQPLFTDAQNYPQPFSASTRINVTLAKDATANVAIYNSKGAKVTTLMRGMQTKGIHSYTWNGTDTSGRPVAAGVYVIKFEADGYVMTKRMLKE